MPDNPEKKGRDGRRMSQQSHEQGYQKRKQNKNGTKENGSKRTNIRDNKKTAG
jgi:hypothetical protein